MPGLPCPGVGAAIKHFELIRELGHGGMGTVFLARDPKLHGLVALKLLTRLSGSGARQFLEEARKTALCRHENIVIIHDVGEHDGYPFMVLEHIEGQSLREWMRERRTDAGGPITPVPTSLAVELMVPVVRALACAHERGIVHCDLKPENVMINASGQIKVLDFGVAQVRESEPAVAEGAAIPRGPLPSGSGSTAGTPGYMSPEQWGEKAEVDPRSDLWTVGIMLYELVTGAHPLAPLSAYTIALGSSLDEPMPRVGDACPEVGPLGAVIDRCLRNRKVERMASAKELLALLQALLPAQKAFEIGDGESPFTGLNAFQEADAARFFGRKPDLTFVTGKLRRQALVAIAGPSGAGKSSFVRAGLIPALKRSGEGWEELIVRPGARPLAALEELCARVAAKAPSSENTPVALSTQPWQLGSILRAHCREEKNRKILLFVDQFEELYTQGADEAERKAFTACLTSAADDASSPLRVVLSIRSDFLDRTAEDPKFALEVTRGVSRLLPMGREELREALMRPIKEAGYHFESDGMVDGMLDELERPGSPLPLLQFTAAKLWEQRDSKRRLLTLSSYERLGGVAGALSTYADTVLAGLTPRDQQLCREVCLLLCTRGTAAQARTRAVVKLEELRRRAEGSDAVVTVVRHLVDARLLLLQGEGDGATVELVHESLIERWAKLQQWLDESNQDAQLLDRLRAAAQQWEANGEDPSLLWRDRMAQEAATWRERREAGSQVGLGKREEHYLQAIVALANRDRRLRRGIAAGVFVTLAAVALIVSFLAVSAGREAAHARDEAIRANREAAHARDEAARVVHAQQAAQQAAAHAARSAAETIALKLDRFKAEVEAAGKDPRVVRAVADPGSPKASEICLRLQEERRRDVFGPLPSWDLFDGEGKMFCLSRPGTASVLGRDYAFRDYFRGAMELAKENRAYVSRFFFSESDNDDEIAISFAVHDSAHRPAGVLAVLIRTGSALGSIEIGDPAVLIGSRDRDRGQSVLGPDLFCILASDLATGEVRPADRTGIFQLAPVRDTSFFVQVRVAIDGPPPPL
jgi:serine/threonine protein kinase